MTDSFMITEGDRSNSATLSKRMKSLNRVMAAELGLTELIAVWPSLDKLEIMRRISTIRESLEAAQNLIGVDDGTTGN